ncbi:MAG: YbhB/YbcL family Raf kinase inhibitor-like protein [Lentilitoribacter sp.]
MRLTNLLANATILASIAFSASAADFQLQSQSIEEGSQLSNEFVFQGFGCEGGNLSPQLSWVNAPQGTKSFAITAYDPDAPTGSGWWHWNVVNIPSDVTSLELGASGTDNMPQGAQEIANDYGAKGFGGACPPPGEVHRYIFTAHALSIEKIDLPEGASNALIGFMIGANTIKSSKITAVYNR